MKTLVRKSAHFAAAVALFGVMGCPGDDSATGAGGNSQLVGTWVASKWEYTNQANASQKVNLVSQGVTVTLTIGATSYSIQFTQTGQPSQTITGTYTTSGNNFVITETGSSSPETIPFTRSGTSLSMTSSDSDWDFDNNGSDEPATLSMAFTLH